ncbi:MAG: hypothetical protein WC757_01680 [Candidatus Paceibacterota bacterium]
MDSLEEILAWKRVRTQEMRQRKRVFYAELRRRNWRLIRGILTVLIAVFILGYLVIRNNTPHAPGQWLPW